MERARSLTVGGGLVVTCEATGGIVALVTLGPVTVTLFLLACSLATAATTAAVTALIARRGGPSDSSGGDPRGGSPQNGPGGPPPWWPGFECDFWAQVERGPARTPDDRQAAATS